MIFGKVDLNYRANKRPRQQLDQLHCPTSKTIRGKKGSPGEIRTMGARQLDRMIIILVLE